MGLIIKNTTFDIGYKSLIFNIIQIGNAPEINILHNTTAITNWSIVDNGNGILNINQPFGNILDISKISLNITPITIEVYNYVINIIGMPGLTDLLQLYCTENNSSHNPNSLGFLNATIEIKFFNL